MNHVCVLGNGAWGTAIATLLAACGHRVTLWSRDQDVADDITTYHVNERYLPGIRLPKTINATTDIAQALDGAQWIFCAVPVAYMRSVLKLAQGACTRDQRWVVLSKGIESGTLLLPSQLIVDVLGYTPATVILSGPSFAQDLARKQITAVSLASYIQEDARALQNLLTCDYFCTYICQDPLGAQIGGAYKNVVALGIGIVDGAGMTDNTQAFFLTRGLHEMADLARAMGAQPATVYELSGVGDLVLTAMGALSRNKLFGQRIGRGESYNAIVNDAHGVVPEGVNTVKSIYQLQQKYKVRLPLCTGIYQMLFEDLSLPDMLKVIITS